jgi:hypothetical protein
MLVKAGAYFGGEGVIYADFDPKKFAELVRADERALAAPVQEPVAWHDKVIGMEVSMDVSTGEDDIDHRVYGQVYEVMLAYDGSPDVILAIESERNYPTPPAAQRQWVGLTQQEVQEIHDTYHKRMGPQEFAAILEAKLKEKNTP